MLSFLVAYGTGEGQTAKVAGRVAGVLEDRGHEATTADLGEESPDIDDYDAVLVGASIHAGHHQQAVSDFVAANRDALAGKPTAFFQVSLSSATPRRGSNKPPATSRRSSRGRTGTPTASGSSGVHYATRSTGSSNGFS